LPRFDNRTFRSTLRKAAEKLDGLCTAEGTPLLESTRAELRHHLARLVRDCNEARPQQGRWCFGKTPMQTFLDAAPMAKEKMIAA